MLGTASVAALLTGAALVVSALAPPDGSGSPSGTPRATGYVAASSAVPPGTALAPATQLPAATLPASQLPTGAPATSGTDPAAAPARLAIPAIGVDSSLVELDVAGDGTLEVPVDAAQAGWFTGGAAPGQPGPAVIAGHVDSAEAPGVFLHLHRLAPGDEVEVQRADGTAVRFVVTDTLTMPKGEFPTDVVYGPTAAPELRLVTCGGGFDRSTGHYEDNVVVFARLAT